MEDLQSIEAHIHGGIPANDIDSLQQFWTVFPSLKKELLSEYRNDFYKLNITKDEICKTVYINEEFYKYGNEVDNAFANWKAFANSYLTSINSDIDIKR